MKVAVTGGTGFVGVRLIETLHRLGDRPVLLTRHPERAQRMFPAAFFPNVTVVGYDPLQVGDWAQALASCDAVVNLAGAPIADIPWNAARKQAIRESRVRGTEVLVEAIARANPRPRVLVSGSAIGYYGVDPVKEFDEYSFPGEDFLATVCKDWERAADRASDLGLRVVKLRTGLVLGYGGVLARLLPLFQNGLGGVVGSGRQWFSWIHRDDLVNLIVFALTTDRLLGALNGTAPNPVTNRELTQTLAQVLQKPAFLPVPAIALQVLYGEAAILVLEGQKVLPKKALQNGFRFAYPELPMALRQILN